jgi:hypothetical protein
VLVVLVSALAAGDGRAALPRVTVITDSVAGALASNPGPEAALAKGLDLQLAAQPCRKLVDPGCPAVGNDHPPSALDTIKTLGSQLGQVVVIDVGYNDYADTYPAGLDEVMQALVAAGVQHVVWVTLEETEPGWVVTNQAIRAAPARWPEITVADWAPVAAGKPWLTDHAHLNADGIAAFATFLRPFVLAACGAPCAPPPPVFCGLARTVNGFDPVTEVKGISCPRARSAIRAVERGAPGPWVCSRAVHAAYELDCRTSGAEVQVLERAPVPASRHGAVVTLANWSFRLQRATLEGRAAGGRWVTLVARPPFCVTDVPRAVLVALRLRRTAPAGGCYAPR